MLYTIPDYYKKFHCTASDCPATCCAGWKIVIDSKSLANYKNRKDVLGNRLANSIDWNDHTFLQYAGRCAFLNEQNLCDLYLEAGEASLCDTCRKYPRHVEVFENEREISLSLSCPEAAAILLKKQEPVRFLTAEDEKEEEDEFDFFLYSILQDCRKEVFSMLQDRSKPVSLRLAEALALTHDVQNRITRARIFEAEEVIGRYQKPGARERLDGKILKWNRDCNQAGQRYEADTDGRNLPELLFTFEVLQEIWQEDTKEWMRLLTALSREEYREKKAEFCRQIPETEKEQLAVYFVFTYFCGAVYDGNALAKMKMAAASVLIWQELLFAAFLQRGIVPDQEERIRMAWRYARELEHSDPNLNQMEKWLSTMPQGEYRTMMRTALFGIK